MNAQLIETNIDGHDVMLSRETIIMLARRAQVTETELQGPAIIEDSDAQRVLGLADGSLITIAKLENDTKYGVRIHNIYRSGQLVNLNSGKAIPVDEPIMIFRAQDKLALTAIEAYARAVENAGSMVNPLTTQSAAERFMKFCEFQREHPERVKEPS